MHRCRAQINEHEDICQGKKNTHGSVGMNGGGSARRSAVGSGCFVVGAVIQ
jgi:hypothetical protein